jgi:hypothetical protein
MMEAQTRVRTGLKWRVYLAYPLSLKLSSLFFVWRLTYNLHSAIFGTCEARELCPLDLEGVLFAKKNLGA